jgi:predicted lipase
MNSLDTLALVQHSCDAYDAPWKGTEQLLDDDGQNRGYMQLDSRGVMIAISGTQSKKDFLTDMEVLQEHEQGGMVHSGFWEEYEQIQGQILAFIRSHPMAPVRLTGHSLGGALATYATEDAANLENREVKLVTIGSPSPGDMRYCARFNGLVKNSVRIVHGWDFVPRLEKINAQHVNGLLHIDNWGRPIRQPETFGQQLVRDAENIFADVVGWGLRDHDRHLYLESVNRFMALL